MNRAGFSRKWDRLTLDSPTEPVEKLFFIAFDNHGTTSNAKRGHDGVMPVQFVCKPLGPLRNARNPINIRDRSPNKSAVGGRQQRSSRSGRRAAGSELLRHSNKVAQRLFAPGKLYGAFEG